MSLYAVDSLDFVIFEVFVPLLSANVEVLAKTKLIYPVTGLVTLLLILSGLCS